MTEKDRLNQITDTIIGAAIQVHKALGPGLLESAYEACLAFELGESGLRIETDSQGSVAFVPETVRLQGRLADKL